MNLFGYHVSQSEPIAGAPIAGALKFATEMTFVVVRSGGSIDHQLHPPLFLVVLKDRKATLISSIDFPRSVFFPLGTFNKYLVDGFNPSEKYESQLG